MNLQYRPYNHWGNGGRVFVDDYSIGYVAQYEEDKWVAVDYDKPEGLGQLFPTESDAIFAVIESHITEAQLFENFDEVEKFVNQFITAEEQQQLAQIDVAIEAAKYGEYA